MRDVDRVLPVALCGVLSVVMTACGGGAQANLDKNGASVTGAASRPKPLAEEPADEKGSGGARCDATSSDREAITYDTSGDGNPDVRKVFIRLGLGDLARLVMICRETDLNGDGTKDVIRYYDNTGASLREDSDRNFDGSVDASVLFQDGRIVRKELDDNYDGVVDAKVYYEDGSPARAERDLAGRSTAQAWRPDRWEYFEDGKVVRMGTDMDGDNSVDRWDRDAVHKAAMDAAEAAAAAEDEASEG